MAQEAGVKTVVHLLPEEVPQLVGQDAEEAAIRGSDPFEQLLRNSLVSVVVPLEFLVQKNEVNDPPELLVAEPRRALDFLGGPPVVPVELGLEEMVP